MHSSFQKQCYVLLCPVLLCFFSGLNKNLTAIQKHGDKQHFLVPTANNPQNHPNIKTNISQRASVILAHSHPGCVCPIIKLWTFGKRQVTSKKAAFVSICKLPVYCIILSDRCFQITTREDGGQALSRAFVCLMLVIGTKAWFTWQNQKPSHRKSQHLSLEYNPMGACVTVWPEPIHEFSRNVQCSLSTDTTCNTCFTLGGYLKGLNL